MRVYLFLVIVTFSWCSQALAQPKENRVALVDRNQLDSYAWYASNSESATHPVGTILPNNFGLFDVYGNVFEWVQDCWKSSYSGFLSSAPTDGSAWTSIGCTLRVLRGGAWDDDDRIQYSSYRYSYPSNSRDGGFGLRVARTLQ
jgi:formylglycine-generating enzyme required for sulfatase activity